MSASPEISPSGSDGPTYDMLDVITIIAENWLALFVLPVVFAAIGYLAAGLTERPWVAGLSIPAAPTAVDYPSVMAFVANNADGAGGFSVAQSDAYYYLEAASASSDEASTTVQRAAATLMNLQMEAVDAEVTFIDGRLKALNTDVARLLANTRSAEIAAAYTLAYTMAGVTAKIDNLTVQRDEILADRSLLTPTKTVALDQKGISAATVAVAIAILSSILIAMLLLARFMWSAVANNPENGVRIDRIQRAFKLKRRA